MWSGGQRRRPWPAASGIGSPAHCARLGPACGDVQGRQRQPLCKVRLLCILAQSQQLEQGIQQLLAGQAALVVGQGGEGEGGVGLGVLGALGGHVGGAVRYRQALAGANVTAGAEGASIGNVVGVGRRWGARVWGKQAGLCSAGNNRGPHRMPALWQQAGC